MERGGSDCGMTHCDADLIESVDDVTGGIDALAARTLFLIDCDAAAVTHFERKRLCQPVIRVRPERRIYSVKGQFPAAFEVRFHEVTGEIEPREGTFLYLDARLVETGTVVCVDLDRFDGE